MRIKSLTELKLLLWEAILATLVVAAASSIIAALPHLEWKHLVLPAGDPGSFGELLPPEAHRIEALKRVGSAPDGGALIPATPRGRAIVRHAGRRQLERRPGGPPMSAATPSISRPKVAPVDAKRPRGHRIPRRRLAARDPDLGRAARARQPVPGARALEQAAGAGVRLRDGPRRPHPRQARELRAACASSRPPTIRPPTRTSARSWSSIRAPGTARASAASRSTARSASRSSRGTPATS